MTRLAVLALILILAAPASRAGDGIDPAPVFGPFTLGMTFAEVQAAAPNEGFNRSATRSPSIFMPDLPELGRGVQGVQFWLDEEERVIGMQVTYRRSPPGPVTERAGTTHLYRDTRAFLLETYGEADDWERRFDSLGDPRPFLEIRGMAVWEDAAGSRLLLGRPHTMQGSLIFSVSLYSRQYQLDHAGDH